jgi:exopolysaccharide production protein ExoQ
LIAVVSISALLAYFSYQAIIAETLANPEAFTGRAGLWRAVLDYSAHHRWLGSGYSSLWGTTVPPPIIPYTSSVFQQFMLHSHSGYLEMLGTTGVPGLVMAVTAAIIIPVYQILRDTRPESNGLNATVLAIVAFCAFENFFETQLYTRDREIWVCFFIAILSLHLNSRRSPTRYQRSKVASGRPQQEVIVS